VKQYKKFTVIGIALLFIFAGSSQAQRLSVGIGGGLSNIQGPDAYTESIENGGQGFDSEYRIGGKAKLGLPLVPVTFTGHVFYTVMNGEGDVTPFMSSIGSTKLETSQTMLSVGVGTEYSMVPGPLSPYLALDISVNNFGELEREYEDAPSLDSKGDTFTRTGLAIGAGVEFTLLPTIDIDVSAKYAFNNLVGKESGEDDFNTINITANVLFSLL
jgi:opacity protein-like surface antigen